MILSRECSQVLITRHYLSKHIVVVTFEEKKNKQNALMMFKIMNGLTSALPIQRNYSSNIGQLVYNFRTSRRSLATQKKVCVYWG